VLTQAATQFENSLLQGQSQVKQKAIFQTFWKLHCCPEFLFFEIETSNFGYVLAYF
jgi:hypothetical protein